ncbi:MAG: transcription antitermination factor NusB [Christensenellaceae bacterium]|jgi:N utilization substance protein B|nr:transcription antitermination factor NusB [Christensenellaceae bacterium]
MLGRKQARESIYQLIHEFLFLKKRNDVSLSIFLSADLTQENKDYISQLYLGVVEKYDSLIECLTPYLNNFSIERLFKSDLAACLLAIYEIMYMPDTPVAVIISEALQLVNTFSTEKSKPFINGVLSSIYKAMCLDNDDNNLKLADSTSCPQSDPL